MKIPGFQDRGRGQRSHLGEGKGVRAAFGDSKQSLSQALPLDRSIPNPLALCTFIQNSNSFQSLACQLSLQGESETARSEQEVDRQTVSALPSTVHSGWELLRWKQQLCPPGSRAAPQALRSHFFFTSACSHRFVQSSQMS